VHRPRAIFFDAADTLFELAEPVSCVYARHFHEAGFSIGEDEVRRAFGQVFRSLPPPDYTTNQDGDLAERAWWRNVVKVTADLCGVVSEGDRFEALFWGLFRHYAGGAAYRAFPEAVPVLRGLKEEGFELVVVSNFDRRLHRIVEELGLAGWFSVVVSSADARSRKPDPGIFQHALKLLDLEAAQVVHIGDSLDADVRGAEQVGIRAFLLERPTLTLSDAAEWIRAGLSGK
jgi:putative hydrolase of the HAD superfamily